jgi:hypothetical protein
MLKFILNLFKSDITIIENNKKDNIVVKNIVKLYSKGNVNLQKGKYITNDGIKQKQKEVFSYKFAH